MFSRSVALANQKKSSRNKKNKKKTPVVLAQDIDKLGITGEIKYVSKGYARNYLIPSKLAYYAFLENLQRIGPPSREKLEKLENERIRMNEQKKMEKVIVRFKRHVGSDGSMCASVTAENVIDKLYKQYRILLDVKDLKMPKGPINEYGDFLIHFTKINNEFPLKLKIERI